MTTPSVSLSVHNRYTPEIRDRILAKLQSSMDETAYHLLTPAELRGLADIESPTAPILSFYLALTPERRVGRVWHTVYSSLAHAELTRIADRRRREAMKEEFDRIECALEAELPALGRGVVFFTGPKLGLWRQIALPLPLPDGIHIAERPYIRPLVRIRDEHDRFVLVLLSLQHNRVFISQIGQVEEVLTVKGQPLRRILTDRMTRDRRDVIHAEAAQNEARVLAHATELAVAQYEARHLLFSGSPDLVASVTEKLTKEVLQRVGPLFAVEVHAGPAEVAAAAEPAQRAVEEREEVATVQRMIDAGPAGAAWGEQPALDAVYLKRAMTLVVDDMFARAGARCGNCGSLFAAMPQGTCPTCASGDLRTVDDIVELAIEETFEERGALELIRSEAARRLMATRGSMAALLRW
jgi:peptide subunit release factor 1 (eRF1)